MKNCCEKVFNISVQNKMEIKSEDIAITNEHGRRVNYIKAPGTYAIHFQKIRVLQPLPNLSGELSATLQVPLFEGPQGLRFDLPYQVIPETGILEQRCDSHSGIVSRNRRNYW